MAKFKKGVSGNPSGRRKGSQNVITRELRDKLKQLIDAELENLPQLLDDLEPKDRVELLIKLLRFTIPIPRPINATAGEPLDMEEFQF